MGIWIEIGNAELEYNQADSHVAVAVNNVTCDDAPDFTDKSNVFEMSYASFDNFVKKAGIHSYMTGRLDTDNSFDESGRGDFGIVENHPGEVTIAQRDVDFWHRKVKAYRDMNPNLKAEYYKSWESAVLAHMMWFEFWVQWAVENCERPAIVNG